MGNLTCGKCSKTMDRGQFYSYKNGEPYHLCKKCLTMHFDNFNPDTFTWALKELDIPYVPTIWNELRDKAYLKDPKKINGMSVFGKYLSTMKLNQWKDKSWADSEALQAENAEKEAQQKKDQEEAAKIALERFQRGEISEVEYKTITSLEQQIKQGYGAPLTIEVPDPISGGGKNPFQESNFMSADSLPDLGAQLTEEDKQYLAMKWGLYYRPSEWIALENKYKEMMESFEIRDSDTIGTLILICKTYLKMNTAIDEGDMDTYQKLSKTYDSLRKSAKFTAAQNKENKTDEVDCIGTIVDMCEKEMGFIPKFTAEYPQDIIDEVLKENNEYVYKLVTQDLGFGKQIEDTLRKLEVQKELDERDLDDFEAKIEDYSEYSEQIESDLAADAAEMRGESGVE